MLIDARDAIPGSHFRICDCRHSVNLPNSAASLPIASLSHQSTTILAMSQSSLHLTRRFACLAALLLPVFGGCALWNWNKADWNLDSFRDSRAVDIDHRLEKPDALVKNPF